MLNVNMYFVLRSNVLKDEMDFWDLHHIYILIVLHIIDLLHVILFGFISFY